MNGAKSVSTWQMTLLLIATVSLAGCGSLFGVNVFVVGERSTLEKQVLGNYRTLSADFESYGSVRGVDEFGRVKEPPTVTSSKEQAMLAMRNRAYNRDDVNAFLSEGLVGEANDGRLVLVDEAMASVPEARAAFIRTVVEEENRDREVLIQRLMSTTPDVTADDEPKVRALFGSLNRDAAPSGARIQREDGLWIAR